MYIVLYYVILYYELNTKYTMKRIAWLIVVTSEEYRMESIECRK